MGSVVVVNLVTSVKAKFPTDRKVNAHNGGMLHSKCNKEQAKRLLVTDLVVPVHIETR